MRSPLKSRRAIPFYTDKTDAAFMADPYERYDPFVLRQLYVQYGNIGNYKDLQEYCMQVLPKKQNTELLGLGIGTGSILGSIARQHSSWTCWGIDYSYQMLRQVHQLYIEGKDLFIHAKEKGFRPLELKGYQLGNLHLGLAKVEDLPFEDDSFDFVYSSFLLDRMQDIDKGLKEVKRVLRRGGGYLLMTPLNFQSADSWERFYPIEKLTNYIKECFTLIEAKEYYIEEALDIRGNHLMWKCQCYLLRKE